KRFTEARIDSSVRKLLAAKHEMGLHRNRFIDVEAVRNIVGAEANARPARIAAEKSITLVRDSTRLVPMDRMPRTSRVVSISVAPRTELSAGRAFDAEMKGAFPGLLSLTLIPETVFDAT